MKYALLIYSDERTEPDPTSDEAKKIFQEYLDFTSQITDAGKNLGGEALVDTGSATTVRVREGEVLTTDGPFAETKEQLGGFYLVEASDLDEAIAIAGRIPHATMGSIEVRPVFDWEANAPG